MLNRDMTRKEFLAILGSFLGLFLLSRLPWAGTPKAQATQASGSYGNNVYGGQGKK